MNNKRRAMLLALIGLIVAGLIYGLKNYLVHMTAMALAGREAGSQVGQLPATPGSGSATPMNQKEDTELATQSSAGKLIDSGFVFIEGRYVDAPYQVTRDERNVYINGNVVWHIYAPMSSPPAPSADPVMPATITKTSSMDDATVEEYVKQKGLYIEAHYTSDEEKDIMEKVYKELPCVKETHREPGGSDMQIETYNGKKERVILSLTGRYEIVGPQAINKAVMRQKAFYEGGLTRGVTYIIFMKGGKVDMGPQPTAAVLPGAVAILRSQLSARDKILKLHEITGISGNPADEKNIINSLVANFAASDQLEQRLKQLNTGH